MSLIPERWDDVFDINGEVNLISTDLLIDMLKKAAEQSQQLVINHRKEYSIWELRNYHKLVSLVFDLCASLKIKDDYVKYNSCELFEEFIHCHIEDLKKELSRKELEESERDLWENIKSQSLLRLLTCIMLSGKIGSLRSTNKLNDYFELIQSFGCSYSKQSILKSEIRVLKTVNYKIDCCPLYSICPLLILTLVYNEPSINGKLLYSILYKIMDYFYLSKPEIYQKLYQVLKQTQRISQSDFMKLISDVMLIGCAITAAAPVLVDEEAASQVLEELSYITCYSQLEIGVIRDVILEGLLES